MDDGQRAVMTTGGNRGTVEDPTPPPGDWAAQAACAGSETPDDFYPDQEQSNEAAALQLCAGCPVRVPCLHHALLTREQHGVWGGMTAKEREILVYGDPSSLRRGSAA